MRPRPRRGVGHTISLIAARRLALARAGLLLPERTGLPRRAAGEGLRARKAALAVIRRFGYLQLDTVSIAGARSHAVVLMSRLNGFDPRLAEELLQPGEPLFEYWGHEACWLPMELYPLLEFRRREFRTHPWWGDIIGQHPDVARDLVRRIRDEGPLRSVDLEGAGSRGWWDLKVTKKVATALWSSGELAIRRRRNFQRSYDLAERVIPSGVLQQTVPQEAAMERLLLLALGGHGWASTSTLGQTWRLRRRQPELRAALARLLEAGAVVRCELVQPGGKRRRGWVRPEDLELAARLERARPRRDIGVLLSPFDPLLWDRTRVETLFGFHQLLEIFKPRQQRIYGYYCLPVLAGERLVARLDLRADRRAGRLEVLSRRFEDPSDGPAASAEDAAATRTALQRFAAAVRLKPVG